MHRGWPSQCGEASVASQPLAMETSNVTHASMHDAALLNAESTVTSPS